MKKKTSEMNQKAQEAAFRDEQERYYEQTPLQRASYRLALVAAPFINSKKTNIDEAIDFAQDLINSCATKLARESMQHAREVLETDHGEFGIGHLREEIQATDKTLRSYVIEAASLDENGNKKDPDTSSEDGITAGEKIWKRLLAGEWAIDREMMLRIEKLRAKRFSESRKKNSVK